MQNLRRIYIILFILVATRALAQEGTPYLTHFEEVKELETQNWSISQTNEDIMLFANRRGILTFDGQSWNQLRLPYINLIEYAGAFNPLYHFRNGELTEYKADRMPIGIYHVEKEAFTNHEITIMPGDTIYLFSDGYADQFGGPAQTKFKSTNLKKLLTEIVDQPMDKQK